LKTFTQTSFESYDRHYYVLHLTGGGHSIWDDYEELRDHWFLNSGWGMSHIEVKDRKPLKSKGFK
jgi:hypothetical protein